MNGADSHGSHGRVPGGIWDRIPLFWRFQLAGWLAFSVFSFPSKWVMLENVSESVVVSIYRDGMGFLITICMRELYRRVYHEKMSMVSLAALVTGVSLGSGLVLTLFSLGFHKFLDFNAEQTFTPPVIFGIYYFRTGLCFGWSLLYFGIKLMRDSMEREVRLALAEASSERAELQMLRAQINPHFLFNSLNTILSALERQKQGVTKMVQSLSDYLNYSLMHKNDDFVLLGEECDALMDYLALEQARFGESLNMACQIDPGTRTTRVPGVLLQPLVENAIKFSRETSDPPFIVRLNISRDHSGLLIEVCNTGRWIIPDPHRASGGVGLDNIRQRLNWLYPGQHTLNIVPEEGWVAVRIRFP